MAARKNLPEKHCATCGRPFHWRKKWKDNWPEIRYCSRACKGGLNAQDKEIEAVIVNLLEKLKVGSSICPTQVVQIIDPDLMGNCLEPVRRGARRLYARGVIDITQEGRSIDHLNFKGAIRLRLKS